MLLRFFAICFLLFAVCLFPNPARAADAVPVIAIRGATLIDGTGKAPVPSAVVVIRGERIAAAAKGAAIPAGARLWSCPGPRPES